MKTYQNPLKRNTTWLIAGLIGSAVFSSCSASIKPIYNSQEQAKAERAVEQFHRLRNEGRLEEIYALLDDSTRANLTKDQFILIEKETLEQWGKVHSAKLSEAKVFPGSPIQVRMIYDVTFEKGLAQEWITWNIRGEDSRLFSYQIKPGFDTPKSK